MKANSSGQKCHLNSCRKNRSLFFFFFNLESYGKTAHSKEKTNGSPHGKMKWKFIGACFMLIWVGETDALKPRSNLCRPRRAYTADCSHQMGVSRGGCSAIIERNNTACWDMNFPPWSSPPINGRYFKLKTYCYNDGYYQRTGLNVTINSGRWTEAAFRFKIERINLVSCVQFIHNASINDNYMLFYDCIWHKEDIYGEQIKVDYLLKDQKSDNVEFGSLHSILPKCHFNEMGENATDISKHQTFIYVDETASSPSTIHIQKMPVEYQISSYIIKKCHTCEIDSYREVECSKAPCTIKKKVETDIDEEEIVLKVPNDGNESCFYFLVEATCRNCSTNNWCVGRSVLLIPTQTGITALPFIMAPLCFLTVVALSIIYCCKKHRTLAGNSYGRPIVLFVYNPVHDVHVKIIKTIGKLMTQYFGIDVLFADDDISKSAEKHPLGWYNEKVSEVDYIAIVSALSSLNKNNSTYNNIFQVGLRIVEQTIKNTKSLDKIINITFPYNLENDVPVITKCCKHFHLMKEFDHMIRHIHKNVNCIRGQTSKSKVHKRMDGWIGCKSLPDYIELCSNIENMKNMKNTFVQEETVCLNTTEDNFAMITFSDCACISDSAEHIISVADLLIEDSRNDLAQECQQSLEELLLRNEHRSLLQRKTDSDSKNLTNMCTPTRNDFVTSIDKYFDLDGLL